MSNTAFDQLNALIEDKKSKIASFKENQQNIPQTKFNWSFDSFSKWIDERMKKLSWWIDSGVKELKDVKENQPSDLSKVSSESRDNLIDNAISRQEWDLLWEWALWVLNNPLTRWIANTWKQIVDAVSQTWKWIWNLVWKWLVDAWRAVWMDIEKKVADDTTYSKALWDIW